MKAGIAIDGWKLEIFERHLKGCGYEYEVGPGVTRDTLLLQVQTENLNALAELCKRANIECARTKQ